MACTTYLYPPNDLFIISTMWSWQKLGQVNEPICDLSAAPPQTNEYLGTTRISSYSEHVPDHKPLVSHRYNCRTILHIYCRHFIWPHPRAVVPLPPPPPHPLPLYDEMTPSLWIYKTSNRSCGSLEYLSGWTSSGSKIYIWCSAQTDPRFNFSSCS